MSRSGGDVRALQFQSGDSWLHRLPPGRKLLAALALCTVALLAEDWRVLLALLALVAAGYALAELSTAALWRDLRWVLLQGAIVLGLTLALRGPDAFGQGSRTALQLVLIFLPMALVVRTTGLERMLADGRRWLPERMAFAVGATVRFTPFFARELGELVEMQRLRGARLEARELWRPRAWRDWLACVAMPMTVRAIEVAGEAADAATIRGVPSPGAAPASGTGEDGT